MEMIRPGLRAGRSRRSSGARRLGASCVGLLRGDRGGASDRRRARRRCGARSAAQRARRAAVFVALIAIDAAAFAIFAFQRNDALGFWQLPGPWADVWRFDAPGVTIALIVYVGGSIMALIGGFRGLRLVEALSLIAIPFLFNLLVTIAADWHMAEIGAFASRARAFRLSAQVAIGRALTLWFLGEAMLTLISLISVNRLPRSLARARAVCAERGGRRLDLLGRQRRAGGRSAVPGDLRLQPLRRARASGSVGDRLSSDRHCSRLARRPAAALRDGVGSLADRLRQRRDLRRAVHGLHSHRRLGPARARRGAILDRYALVVGALGGALAFPLAKTIIGSADGTPPFFGRLKAAYRDPRGPARGVVAGFGLALAYGAGLAAYDGGARFLAMFVVGALAYGGVDLGFDAWSVAKGERLQARELAALCAGPTARRLGRRRARMVLRRRPGPGRDRQVLGLRRRRLPPRRPQARRLHAPIRSSTNTG